MSKEYKYAVFIGRFQPFHSSHYDVALQGLEIAEELIFVIGSANSARNVKNPFTSQERKAMILSAFEPHETKNLHFIDARDYHYNDLLWVTQIQNSINQIVENGDPVVLIGNVKDQSSYYVKYFPQYDFMPIRTGNVMQDATDIRNKMFDVELKSAWTDSGVGKVDTTHTINLTNEVPQGVNDMINGFMATDEYKDLVKEFEFLKDYKSKWDSAPYPPTFITADAVVTCSGHVLVVRRGFNPGKGQLAMPGGFVRPTEKIKDAALRELKEETRIRLDKLVLDNAIIHSKVFDHPGRSLRGRTVTHAYHIKLKDGRLPEVKAGDDADKAYWVPFADVYKQETDFFEDHFHIVSYFLNQR